MATRIIRIHVDNEQDLYEKFDEDQILLSNDFISYLKRQHNKDRHGDIPTIRFISSIPLDEGKIRLALKHYIERALEHNQSERKRHGRNELYLFLIGLVCIVAGVVLSDLTGIVFLQVLSLTAGFAIKEAANIQFMLLPENRLVEREIKFISRANLEFEHTA